MCYCCSCISRLRWTLTRVSQRRLLSFSALSSKRGQCECTWCGADWVCLFLFLSSTVVGAKQGSSIVQLKSMPYAHEHQCRASHCTPRSCQDTAPVEPDSCIQRYILHGWSDLIRNQTILLQTTACLPFLWLCGLRARYCIEASCEEATIDYHWSLSCHIEPVH